MTNARICTLRLLSRAESNPRPKLESARSPQSVMAYPHDDDFKKRRSKDKREVRFNSSVGVRYIGSCHDFTPRRIRRSWYQPYEYSEIMKECKEDLQMKIEKNPDDIEDETFCIRGLEFCTQLGREQRHYIRNEAETAVLDAQDFGCNDIAIAKRYSTAAYQAQRWARFNGLRDQRHAESIHGESDASNDA